MMIVEESGMQFEVDESKTFLMEKSVFFGQLSGMSSCEFVTLDNNSKLAMVEAKTSFSNPNNTVDFQTNVSEIVAKFHDSMEILNAILIRHKKGIVPETVENVNPKNADYLFYLVIKNHDKSWLPPVSDALKSGMKVMFKIWNIKDTSLKVLNEPMARQKGLIQ